jgi:EmrB/QacA subfamily drug resistance transporter
MTTASAAPHGSAPPAPAPAALTHRQILTILAGLMMGMFLAALDQTIVATSIRTIADDLDGLSIQAWATTAYLITATISTPLYGKLSDLYGRRPFFLTAITVFVVGSVLCGFADSMYQLAAFRAVQGLGAGGLFSLALTIIGDIVPPRERAKYQGYFLAVFGTSSVLGPVVGGFLAGQESILGITGWRWVFLVNVPVGALALAVVARFLRLPHTRRDHRIDWPGALALITGLTPLLIVAEQGRTWGWLSGRSLALIAVGAVGIIAFVLAERRYGEDALLPLHLFRGRTFAIGSSLNFIIGMGMFGGLAALPLYLQIVKGATPTDAGLMLLPLMAGIMTGSIISGQVIARTGRYKIFPIIGCALLVLGLALMSTIGVDTPIWHTMIMMAIFGLGLGGNMQPLVLAVQNAVPPQDMGVATSSTTFFRQMGGTLGTAVFLSVLFGTVGDKIGSAFRAAASTPEFQAALTDPQALADPTNARIAGALGSGAGLPEGALDNTSFLADLDERLARPILTGFAGSIDMVFMIGAVVVAAALVIVFFLPEEPLRTLSGIQARQQEEDAADAAIAAEAAAVTAGSSQSAPAQSIHPNGSHPNGVYPDGSQPNGSQPDGVRAAGSVPRATPLD